MTNLRPLRRCIFVGLALLSLSISPLQAAFLPFGVQQNVALSDVTGAWGWTQIYRGGHGDSNLYGDVFGSHDALIMIGAIDRTNDVIALLAATTWTEFNTHTPQNVTHLSNGAEWYNNGGSLGFANAGEAINQLSADTLCTNQACGETRLSWHTHDYMGLLGGAVNFGADYSILAQAVTGGYRAGNIFDNFGSTNLDKIVFTASVSPVPVPAAAWLFGSALLGLFGYGRRSKAMR